MAVLRSRVSSIKVAQKEASLFRIISELLSKTMLDDDRLKDIYVNRVQLSPDKSVCTILFHSIQGGEDHFQQIFDILILYKPSLRKAISQSIRGRYTPDLIFRYDKNVEKHWRLEELMDKVKASTDSDS